MNQKHIIAFTAALCVAAWAPGAVRAQSMSSPDSQSMPNQSGMNSSSVDPSQMVGTRGALESTLDANGARQGEPFTVKLPNAVHLKNGAELPKGTMLMGKVGQDDQNVQGKTKLVLCIDQARTQDGKMIPVKATVVGLYRPGSENGEYYTPASGDQGPNPWHNGVTKVDQMDALHNVDLHSDVKSKNSAVFVSHDGNDIKIKSGTEFALAIAANSGSQQNMGNGGSR